MEPALRGSELYLSPLQTNVYTLSLSRICVYIYIYIYTNLFIYNNNKIIIIMILTIIHTYMRLLDNKADNRSSPSTHSMSGRRRTIPRTAVDFPVPGCKHILHNILVYYIILVHINSYYIISYYIILYHIAHQKSTPHNSSWIFSGMFQWTFRDIFQHNFTFQRHFPKDCHFPSGFLLDAPMDFQWHFPTEFHFCDFWCNCLPWIRSYWCSCYGCQYRHCCYC